VPEKIDMGAVLALALLSILLVVSCKAIEPVSPSGTTLTITANPTVIPETNGVAVITVTAFDSDGNAVVDDTVITLTTTLGTVDSRIETDSGVAIGYLRSNGNRGLATVTAASGQASSVTVEVHIGFSTTTTGISLTASPTTLPSGGGTSGLQAVVFGSAGAVPGATVLFSTTAGSLASGGIPLITDATGKASDTLATPADATVTARTPDPETPGEFFTSTVAITVGTTTPPASLLVLAASPNTFPPGGGSSVLTATVYDTSRLPIVGIPVTFMTTAGSFAVNGSVLTDGNGQSVNTLTTTATADVTATTLPTSVSDTVTVTVASSANTLALSASLAAITTSTPPAPDPCVTGVNPEVPVTLQATLLDSSGNPVDGRTVIFSFQNTPAASSYGQFCAAGATAEDVTGSGGTPGVATVLFTVSDNDVLYCAAASPACSNTFIAESGGVASNAFVITFTP
jgi:hypothetical protein